MRNAGKVVSKTMILSHVWGYSFDPNTNVVDVLVSRLRDKIDRPFETKLLQTVRGVGYVLARLMCGGTIGLRLSLWYAAVFVVSTVLLVGLTYALLATSLAQRDHDIITATLREYASRYDRGGPSRAGARRRAGAAGRQPRAAVRPRGRPGRGRHLRERAARAGRLRHRRALAGDRRDMVGGARRAIATPCSRWRRRGFRTARFSRSARATRSGSRSSRQFRTIVGWVAVLTLVVGVIGGLVLTRSTLRPVYELIDVVQRIISTGRTDERVPARAPTGDAVDELIALVQHHARSDQCADGRHARFARQRRPRSPDADGAAARAIAERALSRATRPRNGRRWPTAWRNRTASCRCSTR